LYTLGGGYKKCASCRRKFSPKKIACHARLLESFCRGESATETAKKYGMYYARVHKKFMEFRYSVACHAQSEFNGNLSRVEEYEEYIYLPICKRRNIEELYGSYDILIFDYGTKIYTTLIRVEKRYNVHNSEPKELKKLFTNKKIAKLRSRENKIALFIDFFEERMALFRGVGKEQFFYYLKECEFFFNYDEAQREAILQKARTHMP
jgi:hypothetical protein